MTKQLFLLVKAEHYRDCAAAVLSAEKFSRVEIKGKRRTMAQNAKFWAMMGELSEGQTYHNRILTPHRWAKLFMDALNREADLVPNLDGSGFVDIGMSTSDLEVRDFSDLIEVVYAWASSHGIGFKEPAIEAQMRK